MNEERLTILRMVAEKKITSDEGERLMDALGKETKSQPSPPPEPKIATAESFKKGTFDFNFKKDIHKSRFVFMKTGGDSGLALKRASFIEEMRNLGFDGLTVEQLTEMKIHGVTPDFVRGIRDLGFENIDVRNLVEFRVHGVSPDFVREMTALGFRDLDPKKIVAMRIHGVTPDFVRDVRQQGFENLTPDQLIAMKIHGVS